MVKKTIGTDVTNYFYNVEDRLARVEDGTGTVIAEYYYAPFGRRLWKEVGGVRTYFLYSDEGLAGEYDSSGVELKAYGYQPNATFTTDPLFMKEGDNYYYFYQNDHLCMPQKITAINGSIVWEARYSSFGQATIDSSSTITNNLRFPGQYYDEETGLQYNYYRYYDPMTGRYLRVDSLGSLIGRISIDEINHLYVYGNNNPINFIDPSGENGGPISPFPVPEWPEYPAGPIKKYPEGPILEEDKAPRRRCGTWRVKSSSVIEGLFICEAVLECVDPNGIILKTKRVEGRVLGRGGCLIKEKGGVCCICADY